MVRNAVLHKEVKKTESPKGPANKTYEGFLTNGHTFMVLFQGQMLFPTSCGYSKILDVSPGDQGIKGFSRRRVRCRGLSGDMITRPPAHLFPPLPQYLNFRRKVGLLKCDCRSSLSGQVD